MHLNPIDCGSLNSFPSVIRPKKFSFCFADIVNSSWPFKSIIFTQGGLLHFSTMPKLPLYVVIQFIQYPSGRLFLIFGEEALEMSKIWSCWSVVLVAAADSFITVTHKGVLFRVKEESSSLPRDRTLIFLFSLSTVSISPLPVTSNPSIIHVASSSAAFALRVVVFVMCCFCVSLCFLFSAREASDSINWGKIISGTGPGGSSGIELSLNSPSCLHEDSSVDISSAGENESWALFRFLLISSISTLHIFVFSTLSCSLMKSFTPTCAAADMSTSEIIARVTSSDWIASDIDVSLSDMESFFLPNVSVILETAPTYSPFVWSITLSCRVSALAIISFCWPSMSVLLLSSVAFRDTAVFSKVLTRSLNCWTSVELIDSQRIWIVVILQQLWSCLIHFLHTIVLWSVQNWSLIFPLCLVHFLYLTGFSAWDFGIFSPRTILWFLNEGTFLWASIQDVQMKQLHSGQKPWLSTFWPEWS